MGKVILQGLGLALRRLLALPAEERRFAARAFFAAPVIEGSLATLGLKRTLGWVDALPRSTRVAPVDAEVGARIVARVYRRHLVRGRCLERAVLQYALHRLDGARAVLEIGVRRAGGAVEAHAWVRGDERESTYEPMRRSNAPRSARGAVASTEPA